MITLYGPARSSAGRCHWCLIEAGVNYETASINLQNKEHKSEAFLKINPNGKVPALVDGDLVLFESMAINYYIAEKYKKELLGNSIEERALIHQWSFWAISEMQMPMIEVLIQKVFIPADKRNQKIIDENMKILPELFNVLEIGLSKNKYLAGNEFTLADINTASVASIAHVIGFDLSKYKNVTNWMKAISDRPGFQKYMALRS